MIRVSVCLPSDALLQHLPSYLGFSYLGRGVCLYGCSSKVQPLLLTLDKGYVLMAAPPDLESGITDMSYPMPEGWWLRGATPCPRPGAGTERSNPMSKEQWLCCHRRAKRCYSTFKVRRGSGEEIPFVQGKEQWLRFAGVAMKRYPMSKVRET